MPKKIIEAKLDTTFTLGNLEILATESRHTDPSTIGFRLKNRELGDIAYTSDTEFFNGLGKTYQGVRLLVLCVLRPFGKP